MVMHCKCMLRELHLLCSITQHFSFCFLDMSLDMSFASLLCSNWPLFSHSQDRVFISLPGCSAPSISASSSCFAGNADTMLAHLLLLHPSLCSVIRHPYSKVDSWKNCPAWCQNLISQKGFEKKNSHSTLLKVSEALLSPDKSLFLKLGLYHALLIVTKLLNKSCKDMLVEYIFRLFILQMRFSQFPNTNCPRQRECNVIVTVLKSVIATLTSGLDLAPFYFKSWISVSVVYM